MDKIEKTSTDIHIKVNSITINGKKPTKLFISQILLTDIGKKESVTILGWVNMQFDNKDILEQWVSSWSIHKARTLLFLNANGDIRRKYISPDDLVKLEKKEGAIHQIYI